MTDHADHTDDTGQPRGTDATAGNGRATGGPPRRDLLAFDRFDRWGLVFLLGAVALWTVLAWVVEPLAGWATGAPLTPELVSSVTVPPLDAAGVGYGPATYAVDLVDPSAGQRLLDLAPGVLGAALVVLACWCIVLLLRTVAAGDPFDPVNVTRLRVVAAVLLLGVPVVGVLQDAADGVLLADLDLGALELPFAFEIPWVPLLAGLVVAMLAEAFKAGSRLRDDVDGLV